MSRHLAGTRPPISPGRRRFAARVGLVVVAAGLATACTDSSAMGPAPDDESVLATPEASLTEPISPSTTTDSPAPTSTVTAPTPSAPGGIDEELVARILGVTWTVLANPATALDLSEVLTGTALEDVENQRQEWVINEWRQQGTAEIVSTELEPTDDPAVTRAHVCVDSADVSVVDAEGNVINDDIPAEETRSLMIVTFSLEGDQWRMSERQFPDDPRC